MSKDAFRKVQHWQTYMGKRGGIPALLIAVGLAAERSRVSLVTALLFLTHPAQVQAVTYIVQQMASLGALFGFVSVILYLEARTARQRSLYFILSTAALILALACKENFFALPAVVATVDSLFFANSGETFWRHRYLVGVLTAVIILLAALQLWQVRGLIASEYARFGLTPWERLLTEIRVIFLYLSILAAPFPGRLQVDYDVAVSSSIVSPLTTILAVIGVIGLIWAAYGVRKCSPLFTFAVVWFLGNLVVESTFLPLDLVGDRKSAGFFTE